MYFDTFIVFLWVSTVVAEIPSYIQVCKRHDPQIGRCIQDNVNNLRPRLRAGIPEIDVPALDPFYIKDVEIADGKDASKLKIFGHDIIVHGASEFIIKSLKLDFTRETRPVIRIALTIPKLDLKGDYDLNAKLLLLPLVGKGEITVNATNIESDAIIQCTLARKGDKQFLRFLQVDMKLNMKDFDVRLSNLFGKDPRLNKAVNRMMKDNKKEIRKVLTPMISRVVNQMVLDSVNKVKTFTDTPYDELLPLS